MSSADAKHLPFPPPLPSLASFEENDEADDTLPSARTRSLEGVGVQNVLGAMIEQRRASQPSFASVVVPSSPTAAEGEEGEEGEDDETTARRPHVTSDVFLKAR